ncbi:MAG TPA: ABC transporter permease subunit [Thermodesulfovibrionales bacterium]|nr:ABC transporter permease subunit [Thermodesulfovibrionales bacterium]
MKALTIARNTFREAIRDRILYNLLFFALLMITVSLLLATLTVGEQSKIIIDIGLGSINIFGALIAIFLGIGLIIKEIEKKTIYNILSKPVPRYQFIAGKYLGLLITITVNIVIMGAGLYLILIINELRWGHDLSNINYDIWKAIYLIFIELTVVTSLALMFSTFSSSSTLSAIFTIAVYFIGHLTEELKLLSDKITGSYMENVINFFYYLLQNFDNFNIKGKVVHGLYVSPYYMIMVTLYGLLYIGAVLLISGVIFQRRDFK